jgi:hypoxanthine-DNA glycosylase
VLKTCKRRGSLDSDIQNEAANDFASFFERHSHITHVFFNGSKAEQSFNKFVLGKQKLPPLVFQRLPSTSPAHAGMRFEEKLEAWRSVALNAPETTTARAPHQTRSAAKKIKAAR